MTPTTQGKSHPMQGLLESMPLRLLSVNQPEEDTVEKILDTAENCPASAIIVEDAETGERLFP